MIPRTIHYCWFGRGRKPKLAEKCINSWKKFCPDYEIIEWDEDNFPILKYPYAKYCYENKKWAYLSDFVRLTVVREYGGIYFDCDVELVKSPDELLDNEAFFGFEKDGYVNTGLGFGAEANNLVVRAMEKKYLDMKPSGSGVYTTVGCPILNTESLSELGLVPNGEMQTVSGAKIYPSDYFNPLDDNTGRLKKTANTVSVHWYMKSALPKSAVIRSKLTKPFHRIFGENCFRSGKK